MNNLTHYQSRIYDKLLPELGKIEPYKEVYRLSLLYRHIKDIEKDSFLFERFKAFINLQLYFHLKSKEAFYDLKNFKDIYETLIKKFIEDNIDADENDFIEKYINSQNEIINKTIEYSIEISGYEPLELIQFLKKDFFEEFIRSSKKKIDFLKSLSKVKEGFNTALYLVKEVYLVHGINILNIVSKTSKKLNSTQTDLYDWIKIKGTFKRSEISEKSKVLGIKDRTLSDLLKRFIELNLIEKVSHGVYTKS